MVKKIVLTGGTFAGKSSLVNLFAKDGYRTIPDIGFEFLTELNSRLGQEKQKVFRAEHPVKFYGEIIHRQLATESNIQDGTVILDRGVYDYIAMMRVKGIDIPKKFHELSRQASPYNKVFILDTLVEFNSRAESGRSLTKTDARNLQKAVTEIYTQFCDTVVFVPEMSLDERYNYIKSRI